MARTKGITKTTILKSLTKREPVWQIGIALSEDKKISKPRCTLQELFNTYFIGLDKYLDKNLSAEELYDKYEQTFQSKNIKIVIRYIDSWGHTWKGKTAWPRKDKFINYLNERINDYTRNNY